MVLCHAVGAPKPAFPGGMASGAKITPTSSTGGGRRIPFRQGLAPSGRVGLMFSTPDRTKLAAPRPSNGGPARSRHRTMKLVEDVRSV